MCDMVSSSSKYMKECTLRFSLFWGLNSEKFARMFLPAYR